MTPSADFLNDWAPPRQLVPAPTTPQPEYYDQFHPIGDRKRNHVLYVSPAGVRKPWTDDPRFNITMKLALGRLIKREGTC